MPRGGRRPGAGRPAGRKGNEVYLEDLEEAAPMPSGRASRREKATSPEEITKRLVLRDYDELVKDGFTADTMRRLGIEAVACVRAHMLRGNLKAAAVMLRQCPPLPMESWHQSAQQLTPEALEDQLRQLLIEVGLPPSVIELVVYQSGLAAKAATVAPDGSELDEPYDPADDPEPEELESDEEFEDEEFEDGELGDDDDPDGFEDDPPAWARDDDE